MCGRFTQTGGSRLLLRFREQFGVAVAEADGDVRMPPERDVTYLPFHEVPIFYSGSDGAIRMREMYWQLIHPWNKEFKSEYTQFNTRAESLGKRHNRELLERQRCVFPVSSFYETRKAGGRAVTPKQVYEFTFKDQDIIPLGGIYTVWTNPEAEEDRRRSCSIITVKPNSLVAEVHDRMPFILPAESVGDWLDRDLTDFETLLSLVKPYNAGMMKCSRVDNG